MMYTRINMLGVNLDIDPVDLPPSVWTESSNMIAKPGAMHRARGWVEVFEYPEGNPVYLLYSPQLGEPYWVYCGLAKIWSLSPIGDHADITPASLSSNVTDGWSGGNLNGLAVLNSLENSPCYWYAGVPGNIALDLPGQRDGTRYRVMRPFKYHLIGMGVVDGAGDYRDAVHWSDAADPGQIPATWVPAADNEAGDNILSDENGDIIDGAPLRDSFFIYKQDSIYEMTYIGGASVFRFRKVFGATGVLTKNCIVRVKGTHVVLGNGDIYQHDGQNMQSIVDGRMRNKFFSAIDNENYKNSFVVYSEADEEVWFCVPSTGETNPSVALVWNVTTNEFGYRELPRPFFAATGVIASESTSDSGDWDGDPGQWNQDTTAWLSSDISATEDAVMLAVPSYGDIGRQPTAHLYKANATTTFDGLGYTSTIGRLGLDLGDPQREKAIRRVWPHMNAPAGTAFTLELFNQRDAGGGQEQVEVQSFEVGTEGVAVNCNARYLGVRVSTDASVDWDISGLDIEYMPQGRF